MITEPLQWEVNIPDSQISNSTIPYSLILKYGGYLSNAENKIY
jgi:hypothetical protein